MHTTLPALSNFCGAVAAWLCLTPVAFADGPLTTPSTLARASTSSHQTFTLSFVIWIAGGIFLVVGGLLRLAPFRLRARKSDPLSGPAHSIGVRKSI
jgi:hypothetical protein